MTLELTLENTRLSEGPETDAGDYCRGCKLSKAPSPNGRTLMLYLLALYPLKVVAIDYIMLEKLSSGLNHVLLIAVIFTKLTVDSINKSQTTGTTMNVLGIPERLRDDLKTLQPE